MRHLIGRYGNAAQGGVRFYNLDNEPGLWNSTHRDVHPLHPSYNELTNLQQYAAAIKAVDPGALTLGPVQDGWTRYYYASYLNYPDQVAQGDRDAHGGKPFVQWYLEQMAAAQSTGGVRLLDYFDLHYYPQADGVSLFARRGRRHPGAAAALDPRAVGPDLCRRELDPLDRRGHGGQRRGRGRRGAAAPAHARLGQ